MIPWTLHKSMNLGINLCVRYMYIGGLTKNYTLNGIIESLTSF